MYLGTTREHGLATIAIGNTLSRYTQSRVRVCSHGAKARTIIEYIYICLPPKLQRSLLYCYTECNGGMGFDRSIKILKKTVASLVQTTTTIIKD